MTEGIALKPVTGEQIEPYIDDLARLRITVFREFPYLYDGDLAYERKYLRTYARSPRAVFVLAMHGDDVVGTATGIPLADEEADFQRPIAQAGFDVASVFYFGESVLLPGYRGRGIGHGFFDHREAHARSLQMPWAVFCAVERPADHPRRPANYRPLHAFWRKRGFECRPDITTTYTWKDLDEADESPKPMTFWVKRLQPAGA